MLFLSYFFSINKYYFEKTSEYECGFSPFNTVFNNFDIKYYLIALLFLIFDVEIIFLLPLIFCLNFLNFLSFFVSIFFLLFLFFGFYYEWNKGGLEWN